LRMSDDVWKMFDNDIRQQESRQGKTLERCLQSKRPELGGKGLTTRSITHAYDVVLRRVCCFALVGGEGATRYQRRK